MSYSGSAKDAFASYIGWFIASAFSPIFPYHMGVLIPIASIFASISDIGQSTGPAILGAIVTLFLALVFQDQITATLSVIATIVGLASLLGQAGRSVL